MAYDFYAVAVGVNAPCVVNSWAECEKLVNGFPNAMFKGFWSEDAANQWLKNPQYEYKNPISQPNTNRLSASQLPMFENRFTLHPELRTVYMYTDGACRKNPGAGGWACILKYGEHEKILSGGEPETTNNRMELMAVLQGLMALKEDVNLIITTDSKYVADGIEKGWAKNWKRHMWMKCDGTEVPNADLWDDLLCMLDGHNYVFEWVKGHDGHPENERCDKLAVEESHKF